ncbi:hypothetical protein [Nitrospira sp. KM1]|uniref:hypothetical protein n=1 Tax=Nitrospira sp. KM1 TaxID=1936990 RepID=UPI001566025B|nr:hypothetical protein [Nitrospira sp. KM1]
MKIHAVLLGILLVGGLAGCSTAKQQTVDADGDYIAPASIYTVMDSTSLVYTDVAAGAALNDHPLRWVAFVSHPVGQGLDYGINRPLYTLSSKMPYLFGYTSEDSMLDSQRR